jgi:Rrf2 family protein
MVQLAATDDDGPISCRRLAEAGGMPERFLLQILRSLVTNGLLESTRGVEGGYRLARDPAEVSVLDIVESIDGPFCLGLPQGWENDTVESALSECCQRVRRELNRLTLDELAPKNDGSSASPQAISAVTESVDGNVAAAAY